MKKMMLLGVLLACAAPGFAQESRQDVSFSGMGLFAPQVNGNGTQLNTNGALGLLLSYRYMVTPRSGLELNYSFAQNQMTYRASFNGVNGQRIHTREQELSAAYVYNFTYKRFNPFVEAGPGVMLFTPILDYNTQSLDTKSSKGIGGVFGGGVAYELSPSWDLRLEYRGFLVKAPSFGISTFNTNRYEVISLPTFGVAYHF